MNNHFVIIVAAGTGSRMGTEIPKQFLELHRLPVLMQTIMKFENSKTRPQILVVLAENMIIYWKELCEKYSFEIPHHICSGGNTRFSSVKNGLNFIQENSESSESFKIAVHDAARPLLSVELIDSLYNECNFEKPAIIPAVQSTNSVRIGNQEKSEAIDRNQVWLVQTPQVFQSDLLISSYEQEENNLFTDDASVVEKMSNNLFLFPGENKNIKITHEEDLIVAHYLFNKT